MVGIEVCDFCGCDDCETQNFPAFDDDDPTLESMNACASCAYDMGLDCDNEDWGFPECDDDDPYGGIFLHGESALESQDPENWE